MNYKEFLYSCFAGQLTIINEKYISVYLAISGKYPSILVIFGSIE